MSKRSDALYVRDIKEAIEAIFSYTRSITFDDFKLDRMRCSAVIREFELNSSNSHYSLFTRIPRADAMLK